MAFQTPGCNDSEWQLLFKILQSLPDISTGGGGGGGGDVFGPASSINNDIVTFNGVTGKLIKDSGVAISSIVTNTSLQAGSQAIGAGVTTQAVVFPTAFASPPSVVATMSRPAGGVAIQININSDTITALGFSTRLSAATPNATYILQWMAKV